MSVLTLNSIKDLHDQAASAAALVVHFAADWAEQCSQIDTVLLELAKEEDQQEARTESKPVVFCRVDAELVPDLSTKYGVSLAPTVVLLLSTGAGEVRLFDRVEGADTRQLTDKVRALVVAAGAPTSSISLQPPVPKAGGAPSEQQLNERLRALISRSHCMVFMKGTPEQPRCGFSRTLIEILRQHEVAFDTFDILTDNDVRQGLKTFSNWPTYPQVYAAGELIGGLDIIRDLDKEGELKSAIGV